MSLTRLAVHRPVTTCMASLVVVLLGWLALRKLTVDLMPDMTFPTVSVVTLYRGAAPTEVETLITRPLEQAFSSVSGIDRISSTSSEGASTVRVRFQWDTDLDAAIADMRQAVSKIRTTLPDDMEEPYIRKYDITDSPMMYIGLTGELDNKAMSLLAERTISPRLERIEGVARVGFRGRMRREIQVDIDRDKLESLNMGVNEVVAALRRENVNTPAGDFESGNLNLLVRSRGEFRSLQEIEDTVIHEADGAAVHVRDVAAVVDGVERQTELTRLNGEPAVMVYIHKQSGANTIAVSDSVRKAIDELNESLRQATLTLRVDKSDFIRSAISNVRQAAIYGMGLAMVVLLIFLRSIRSTLVIAVSMPMAVLATFVLIHFQGYTLNMVSFGGLALGIGLLVDNSIVVLESIFRKHDQGLGPEQSAIEGTQEVASAIVASTITTLIVFVPLLFIDGMTGLLLHQLAAVVSFSLVCSLMVSLTLTPVLASRLMSHSSMLPRTGIRAFSARIARLPVEIPERIYSRGLRTSLRWPGVIMLVLLAAFSAVMGLTPRVGTEYIPKADEGELGIRGEMTAGIQLDVLNQQAQHFERIVLENVPESKAAAAFIGDQSDDSDQWHRFFFRIQLTSRSERDRGIDDISRDLNDRIGQVPGVSYRVKARSSSMMWRMFQDGGELEVEVRGHDPETANQLAAQVESMMKSMQGVTNVHIQQEPDRPELSAWIDRSRASLLGVSVSDIADVLETTVRGTEATVFRDEGDEFNVLVRLRERDRNRRSDIEQVSVATASGQVVPLKNLVEFSGGASAVAVNRLDQQRFVEISADLDGRDLGSAASELTRRLRDIQMPLGFSANLSGDWEEQQESFAALRQGFIIAVLLMYMVMASQFESLRDPLLILVTIPLAAIGVVLVFVLTETTLNVQSYIGLVMLSGIVVNNAIVLVDYVNRLRAEGPDRNFGEIVHEAAVRRFRPIIMTTLTTVLAMLPIAMGLGDGGELQAPMARVVIGGLTSATLITLVAIPLLLSMLQRKPTETGGGTEPAVIPVNVAQSSEAVVGT